MENEYKIKVEDFIPIIGMRRCISRYFDGSENNDKNGSKYLMKGTIEIMGLAFYNLGVIVAALEGLEKLVN